MMSPFRLLSNVMLLIIVLSLIIILLLGSPLGTKTISKMINNSNTGVELTGAKGSLLTGLKFDKIHWHDDKVDVQLKDITLKPNKLAYINNKFSASLLSTEQLIITVKKTSDKKVVIPNIPLPFNFKVDQLKLKKLLIKNNQGKTYFQANNLEGNNIKLIDQVITSKHLQGQLDIHHQAMDVNFNSFQLQLNQPHRMNGQGHVDYKHPLIGHIQGNATIGGTLTHYTLDTKVKWKEFTSGKNDVNLTLKGDYKHITIQSMQIHNAKGDVKLQGKISWLPKLVIDTTIEGKNIQAQQFNPQLPNNIDLKTKLLAQYDYDKSEWEVVNHFKEFTGILNQHRVNGKGSLELKNHILSTRQFQLQSKHNSVKIDGRITEPFQLAWDIDAKKIEEFIPSMTGSIVGKGQLKGTTQQPSVMGKVRVNKLSSKDLKIGQAVVTIKKGRLENNQLIVSLSANVKNINYKNQQVKSATIDFNGHLDKASNLPVGSGTVTFNHLKTKDIAVKSGSIQLNKSTVTKNKLTGSIKTSLQSTQYKDYQIGHLNVGINGALLGKNHYFNGHANIKFQNLKNNILKLNIKQGTIALNNGKQLKNKLTGTIQTNLQGAKYQDYQIGDLTADTNGTLTGQKNYFSGNTNIRFHHLKSKNINTNEGTIVISNIQQNATATTGAIQTTLQGLYYQGYKISSTKADFKGTLTTKDLLPSGRGKIQLHNVVGNNLKIKHGLITITDSKLTANKRLIITAKTKLDGVQYQQYRIGSTTIKVKGQHFNQRFSGEGSLELNTLQHPSLSAKYTRLQFNGNAQKFNLTGSSKQLTIAKHHFINSTIKASGNLKHHQVTLTSKGGESLGLINIVAQGGWHNEQWQGRIQQVQLKKTSTGQWSLNRPVQLTASTKKFSASEICITNPRRGSLCSTLNWQAQHGISAKGKLNHVPLVQFKEWLPSNIKLLGTAIGHFDIKQSSQGHLTGYAKLQLPDSAIIIHSPHEEDTKIQYQHGKIDLHFKGRQITSKISLTIKGRGQLNSEATIKLGSQLNQHRINGKAQFTVANLSWLQEFFPDITRLKGGIKSSITFQGALVKPSYQGSIKLTGGQFSIPDTNTHLKNINLLIKTNQPNHATITGSLQTGGGTLNINGSMVIKKLNDWSAKVAFKGKNLQFINTQEVSAIVSPDILLKVSPHSASVTGNLHIPSAELRLEDLPETAIYESDDVVFVSDRKKSVVKGEKPLQIIPNVNITLGKKINFNGFGLRSRLEGKLHITQNNKTIITQGNLNIIEGQYRAYGQSLIIEHGVLVFNGSIGNPGLNIRARRFVDDYQVGLNIAGTLQQPKSSVFSDSALSESDALSYLITGQSLRNNSGDQAQILIQAIRSLGINSGGTLLNNIGSSFGLDDINIITFNDYKKSKIQLGKRLGSRLYIRYITGLFDSFHKVALDYKVNKLWSVQAEYGEEQGIDFIYEIDRD